MASERLQASWPSIADTKPTLTCFPGKDIIAMMDNWVSKMGYPLLTVSEKDGGIHVRQDRFLETGPAAEKDNQTIW